MENQSQIYEKEIQITNISQRSGTSAKGNQYTAFTLHGNDGISYSTLDKEWASQRKVGETLKIKYRIRTSTGANSQVYTNYDIVLPGRSNYSKVILDRIDLMEKNILLAITGATAKPAVAEEKSEIIHVPAKEETEPEYPPKESDVEVVNVDEPAETTETKEIPNAGKPF